MLGDSRGDAGYLLGAAAATGLYAGAAGVREVPRPRRLLRGGRLRGDGRVHGSGNDGTNDGASSSGDESDDRGLCSADTATISPHFRTISDPTANARAFA